MSINEMLMAAAGSAGGDVNYIDDCFATHLYTGNDPTGQTINNGIDLSTKGGLVWLKSRSAATNHNLFDTVRGVNNRIFSNLTNAQATLANSLTSFNANGFTLGSAASGVNTNADTYCSWTFAEQEKFFDVVTYTGDGVAGRNIAHNLGSVPGMMIVKVTNTADNWRVYHRSLGNTQHINLNTTAAAASGSSLWNNTTPTSTVFTVGDDGSINGSGNTYVAYLFAHDAGGFGAAGTDNVISCGSFTTDGSGNATVSLGYEPQYMLLKCSSVDDGYGWLLFDNMRGWNETKDFCLKASSSNAEFDAFALGSPTATGFYTKSLQGSSTYIYMAIRRPMAPPTLGTQVFSPVAFSGNGGSGSYTNSFPTDMIWHQTRNTAGLNHFDYDRLRGINRRLNLNTTDAEGSAGFYTINTQQNLVSYSGNASGFNASGETYIDYNFRRATGFFDEVCYTGTDAVRTITHNLGVAPELMIVKCRSIGGSYWTVYSQPTGNTDYLYLSETSPKAAFSGYWNNTTPTASVFTLGTGNGDDTNATGKTYVAYLFATLAGVSKVGSYTGNGSNQTINCGFAAGARFVLIKRTDSTGDWYVWDTARGIVSGNDPYLLLNSTAAEVTNTDYIDPVNSGFELSSTAPAAINANGGSFIFMAIA